jgi:putative oxidoreductase
MNHITLNHQKNDLSQHGVTLLRLSLGTMWIAHALLKWWVFTLPGTAQFFASVGFPGWMAYPVFAAELLGGMALVLGIYARQAPPGCTCPMAGCTPAPAAAGSTRCF